MNNRAFLKSISPIQMRIIGATAVMAIVFGMTWRCLYVPTKLKVQSLQDALAQVESSIQAIESARDPRQTVPEEIALLKENDLSLSRKLPFDEEESFQMLVDLARSLNLEVISVESQAPSVFADNHHQEVVVAAKAVQKLPVSLQLRGRYQDLLTYLEKAKQDIPAYVRIDGFSLRVDDPSTAKLRIQLNLNLYLLGEYDQNA